MATGARHAMYICEEREYGVLPENPVFMPLPHVATDIGLKKALMLSQEARADRQLVGMNLGVNTVSGSLSSEIRFGAFDTLLEGVFDGAWVNGYLRPGVVRRSYSILRHFEDLSEGKKFILIKGIEFKGLKIKINAKKLVAATFQMIGQSLVLIEDVPEGSTFLDVQENEQMDGFSGYVKEGGEAIGVVSELEFSLDKKMNPRFVICDKNTIKPGLHGSSCKGSMTAFFEDSVLLEKFINEQASSLETQIGSSSESYTFGFQTIRYSGGKVDASGAGDIPLNLQFEPVYPLGEEYPVMISRRYRLFTEGIVFEFDEPVYTPGTGGIIFEFDEPMMEEQA